ncbi:MAG: alginate lyase family protein [Desulfuromonadales bacterium]|nr:alginate lyase family protein [Desulfuromonadales bacterium]
MFIESCLKYFHTLKHLKLCQIYGRVLFRLQSPAPDLRPASVPRQLVSSWQMPIAKPRSFTAPDHFRFLNQENCVECPAEWNSPHLDKLWLYNLHYFDDLTAEAAAERTALHVALVERWIDENTPGQGNGWEPYPLSLRIVNWLKWGLAGNNLPDVALQNLAVQIRFLCKRLEYHLLGNHLFANAKALVFGGLFFEGVEADGWLDKGWRILAQQLSEQVLADGGHFERSPMYHAIILEDLLDLINILNSYGKQAPVGWIETAQRMLGWFAVMQHPDGEIVLFNDSAFGIAARPEKLFDYAQRLGVSAKDVCSEGLTHLQETGYVKLQNDQATVFLDVAPIGPDYLPGHAHADTLSFELSLFGRRVIVDSGTSCYGNNDERHRQRGTAAHNTVVINGENSSEVWSGFRVARRARPSTLEMGQDNDILRVACAHDGFSRLKGKPEHRREWTLTSDSLKVKDSIQGHFKHATGRLYLHPDVKVNSKAERAYLIVDSHRIVIDLQGAEMTVVDTTWHPEFGLSIPNKCLQLNFRQSETTIRFSW